MDKAKEILLPQVSTDDQDKLFGDKEAGTEPQQPVRNPLAQGDIRDEAAGGDGPGDVDISAPAELTGMTGQYITGKDAGSISEQERKKHGTAMGLASATMASGAVGEQHPSAEPHPPTEQPLSV